MFSGLSLGETGPFTFAGVGGGVGRNPAASGLSQERSRYGDGGRHTAPHLRLNQLQRSLSVVEGLRTRMSRSTGVTLSRTGTTEIGNRGLRGSYSGSPDLSFEPLGSEVGRRLTHYGRREGPESGQKPLTSLLREPRPHPTSFTSRSGGGWETSCV